jgi:hypothetical protein
MSDEKPPPRRRDPGLLSILKLEHDCCEITGVTWDLHLHHVHLRSRGGDDVRSNIVCIDQKLHERYHRGDDEVRAMLAWHVHDRRPDVAAYLDSRVDGGFDRWFTDHTHQLSFEEEQHDRH